MSNPRISNPTSRIEFTPEFKESLESVRSGVLTKERIIREPDCEKALRGAMAYNFLFFDKSTNTQPIDYKEIESCKVERSRKI
ncbi:hypothetical protein AQUSIP_01300 [Aquicella siphonis]|uniref:Uncharacterized protein n=1 Tax=Aquicella siphonis TaxID=254247 RepID=A0A5E4PEU0_9COXI|nr:hypothetical protein AQUSIP_01300 [Aquicella siphonis]